MNYRRFGFTIVELLTVLAIIAILVGILLPTLSFVRNTSKNTAQRAQLTTIDMALLAFRNDQGYYPPSETTTTAPGMDYCGAQRLTEALLGWDLLGFHPQTVWRADGFDRNADVRTYDPLKVRDDNPADGIPDTLTERRGPYLELSTTNIFRLGVSDQGDGLYQNPAPLAAATFVICDVFGAKRITIAPGRIVKGGTPILYFRANAAANTITGRRPQFRTYNVYDNMTLIDNVEGLRSIASGEKLMHPLGSRAGTYQFFYDYIADPRITDPAPPWPYRPDSYILISAGVDGLYGTSDDICNFAN